MATDTPKDTTSMLQAAWMADLRRQESNVNVESGQRQQLSPAAPSKDSIPAYIQQLDTAFQNNQFGGGTDGNSSGSKSKKWYLNALFLQACTCLGVFLLTFVLVVLIRPSFLNKRKDEDDPMTVPKFSPVNAVYMALATMGVALIAMVAIALVQKNKNAKGSTNTSAATTAPKTSLFEFNRKQ